MRKLSLLFSFLLITAGLFAQRTVTGTVTDDAGEPLIGANILVKGSTVGTITDIDGEYSLEVPEGFNTLVVSYTGYGTQEVTIGDAAMLDVTLAQGLVLGEAVVTALGISRDRKSLGYAVQQVDGEDLSKARETNIVNSLTGKIAGVQISSGAGNMGGSARILIRGANSFTGNNQPLFVVDGIPMDNSNFTTLDQARGGGGYDYGNSIQDLNPDDIESVSVLKGQAASALYGSRGSNGVIIINTKRGEDRKNLGVSVNSGIQFSTINIFPEYQNEYGGGVTYGTEHGFNEVMIGGQTYRVPAYHVDESWGPRLEGQQVLHWDAFDEWDTQNYLTPRAWDAQPGNIEDFYETGRTITNNVAVTGGSDVASFRLSYTNHDQTDILPNSELKRNTISFNGDLDLSDDLRAFAGMNYINTRALGRPSTGYDGDGLNVSQMFNQWFHRQVDFGRLENYKNPDGTQRTWNRISATNPNPNYWDNPYWVRYENFQNDERDRLYGNFGLTYDITDWLDVTGRVMTDFYNERREERIAVGSITTSKYVEDLYKVGETNLDLMFNVSRNLSDDLSLDAQVGTQRRIEKQNWNLAATRDGLKVPGFYNLENSVGTLLLNDYYEEKEVQSVYGRASLGFKSFLYLDVTGRNDWSSALPVDNNSYFYPSVSGSFVFSEVLDLSVLSFGKLRAAWAQTGSDTRPYRTSNTFAPLDNIGGVASFSIPNTLNNPDLKPEQTSAYEFGIEVNFWQDRIGLDVTYYNSSTTNQIVPVGTSGATGYTSQYVNAGEMINKGIEISLYITPVRNNDFNWDIGLNFAKNENEVAELFEGDENLTNILLVNAPFAVTLNAFEGQPYGTILGYDFLYDDNGNKLVNPANGYYMKTSQLVPIGTSLADFTGGIWTRLNYKGLSISGLVDFQKGGDLFSLSNTWGKYSGLFIETVENNIREDGIVVDGVYASLDAEGNPIVIDEGDPDVMGDETYQSTGQVNETNISATTHFFVHSGYSIGAADTYDASFMKFRELKVSYTLPQRWLGNSGIGDLTLSFVGRNLAVISKNVPHIDPESAVNAGNIQGLEGGQVPSPRTLGFNLSFNF